MFVLDFFTKDKDAVTVVSVKQALDSKVDVIILDVREQAEYEQGHITGSILVPLSHFEKNISKIPDTSKKIYVSCRSGSRSSLAVKILKNLGYTDVHNMTGGLLAWREKGYPLVK